MLLAMNHSHMSVATGMPFWFTFSAASHSSAAKTAAVAAFNYASQNHHMYVRIRKEPSSLEFSFYSMPKFSLLSVQPCGLYTAK